MASDELPQWTPSTEHAANAQLTAFRERASKAAGRRFENSHELHHWSVTEPAAFWELLWDFCDVISDHRGPRVLEHPDRMPGARWFPDARLNFAENLLRRRDDATALIFQGEDRVRRELTFAELATQVAQTAALLRSLGVEAGDRVAGVLPNLPEAIIGMLASSSIGAIWSSCSPDFGPTGIVDRFGQIEPKILLCSDGYFYNGKAFDTLTQVSEVLSRLPSVRHCLVVSYTRDPLTDADCASVRGDSTCEVQALAHAVATHAGAALDFAPLPFDHPLVVLYSSGTTGRPKCIVHGAGGTLLQHLKEHRLHVDLKPDQRFFYFTTCGWMMWNWLVSGLASGATLVLFDGSPSHQNPDRPKGSILFDLADREAIEIFGTSAKFLDAASKAGLEPRKTHSLAKLRSILSTGSPLVPEGFDYVYQKIKTDVHLASISGGTDIISCFVLGDPTLPVWRGEIQAPGLGMRVDIFDDDGQSVSDETGELVCTAPFPSMPVEFWNDPDGKRYHAAYFERFPSVWCHGDWIRRARHGGFEITGRSDAVLNPGGVRIGTAEIYRAVERLDEVVESIAIGQQWLGDVRVVLFVVLRDDASLDSTLEDRIRHAVRTHTTPRHVPAKILAVSDIPRTRSGKITELAVRDIVHGSAVKNEGALANPEALAYFANRPELAS